MGVNEKLLDIQQKLKAPKGQFNSFGKYKYRSLEDIWEAVKPLLADNKCTLICTDEIVNLGDRFYVKATAVLTDVETGESVSNVGNARESFDKKGMDDSQITGTASSYARKYALNGLFAIDDTKDADTDEYRKTIDGKTAQETIDAEVQEEATEQELKNFRDVCEKMGIDPKVPWQKTGKNGDKTKAHLGLAMKWVQEHATATGAN